MITLLTVSYQSIKAAHVEPGEQFEIGIETVKYGECGSMGVNLSCSVKVSNNRINWILKTTQTPHFHTPHTTINLKINYVKKLLHDCLAQSEQTKLYSAINIVGLAIGMAACIVIMLFVFYERSFDRMHTKNIYRLNEVQKFPGMVSSQKVALSMFPMGPTLKNEFPEINNYTRINWR